MIKKSLHNLSICIDEAKEYLNDTINEIDDILKNKKIKKKLKYDEYKDRVQKK